MVSSSIGFLELNLSMQMMEESFREISLQSSENRPWISSRMLALHAVGWGLIPDRVIPKT